MIPKIEIEEFIRVNDAINEPVTKFGGQPVWLTEPQWPISSGWDNRPMMFVAQVALDKKLFGNIEEKMAYIFVTHAENPEDDFFDPDIVYPDEGENAIIIQPGGQMFLETQRLKNGPTLFDSSGLTYEGYVKFKYLEDPEFIDSNVFRNLSEDKKSDYCKSVEGNKIGGVPYFFQGDEWPEDGKWKLLMQLNSNFLPFYLNLGASPTAFAFISDDLKRGKLLIQDM
ncbi:DUF1963 domain-containing protein [Clostridium sp. ATCC 25772]|uniref:DUF1963 domain-containing protein n=1 Tax=Clostridium sp. ATCC 25772 TaxID=1676991 RepID=UPI000783F42A|nr:DUF1963 domain-containing protein [Clostridium sp. ATCC 25772]